MLIKMIIFIAIAIEAVKCGCRKQKINDCESICRINEAGKYGCELRGAVILPDLNTIEASMPRVSVFYVSHLIFTLTLPREWENSLRGDDDCVLFGSCAIFIENTVL